MKTKISSTADAIHLTVDIWEHVVEFGHKPLRANEYSFKCPMCHHFRDCHQCRRIINWSTGSMATMTRCDDPNDGLYYYWRKSRYERDRALYAKEILNRLKMAEMNHTKKT